MRLEDKRECIDVEGIVIHDEEVRAVTGLLFDYRWWHTLREFWRLRCRYHRGLIVGIVEVHAHDMVIVA